MPRRGRMVLFLSLPLFACNAALAWQGAADQMQEPVLRVEAGGPTSYVTSLAFEQDGKTLYSAGWDKLVRVWSASANDAPLAPQERAAYRVPIGPGLAGTVNAIALAPDGETIAVAGRALLRGESSFRDRGIVFPREGAMTPEMRADEGTIFLFDTQSRAARSIRGHKGAVLSLAFAPARENKPPVLASLGVEGVEGRDRKAVLYLWDAQTGKYLDGMYVPVPRGLRPPLALWHTGDGPKQLRVVVALGDQTLLWDVETGKTTPLGDGGNQLVAVSLPSEQALATSAPGGIQFWTSLGKGQSPTRGKRIPLPGGTVATAAIGSRATDGRDLLAAIAWDPKSTENRLVLLDPRAGAPIGSGSPLWRERKQPVLASGTGRVAVGGSPDHHIALFSLADLSAGKGASQSLAGVGTRFEQARFVRQGDRLGLRLVQSAGSGSNAAVFDFQKPGLVAADPAWVDAESAVAGWKVSVEPKGNGANQVVLERPDGSRGVIPLGAKQTAPLFAVAPQTPSTGGPVLVLSLLDEGQPRLWLHDATTMARVRECNAHSDRITGLSFSNDGRLLASTSDDQTVAIWSLVDLNEVIGKLGGLPGVAVEDAAGKIVVKEIDRALANGAPLAEGSEVLATVAPDGGATPLKTPQDFYLALARRKPGEKITFRVAAAGGPRDLVLTVGQGTDERKPLVTLFVERGADLAGRAWIGWNPVGPYESSGESADRLLGWHFNYPEPEIPASLALAKQYRKTYYRPDLLKDLIRTGLYEPPAAPPPPPPPQTALWLHEEGSDQPRFADGGLVRLSRIEGTVNLSVHKFPVERVAEVALLFDGQPAARPRRTSDREWQADLASLPWGPTVHSIRVVVKTDETPAREFSSELEACYLPPPPALSTQVPETQLQVKDAVFSFGFAVRRAAGPAEAITVRLVQRQDDKPLAEKEWTLDAGGAAERTLAEALELKPGVNVIEVTARPARSVPGEEEAQTARLVRVIALDDTPAPPPAVTISSVREITDSDQAGTYVRAPGARIVVTVPKIRIAGTIRAPAELTLAELRSVKSPEATALTGFQPNRDKTFSFEQEVTLRPGPRELVFLGKYAGSQTGEARLLVDYRPILPSVRIAAPADGAVVNDSQEVELVGEIVARPNAEPFQVMVVLNGSVLPRPPVVEASTGRIATKVRLKPGENRLQLRVANEWNLSHKSPPISVSYRRPPAIVSIEQPVVSEKPLIDIRAKAKTPKDVPLTRVEINDRPIPLEALKRESSGDDSDTWTIDAKNVPLASGANKFHVKVWNSEGASTGSESVQLTYSMPAPAKADVEFLSPRLETIATEPSFPVRLRVRSLSPLVSVELARDREVIHRVDEAQLAKLEANPGGIREWRLDIPVELKAGANLLTLRAVNAGGEAASRVAIGYVEQPVRIVVDGIETPSTTGNPIVPKSGRDNVLVAQTPITEGRATLRGRIVWANKSDEARHGDLLVRVFANGFQQIPVKARPGVPGERAFAAEVVLNRDENNIVEIDLPGLAADEAARSVLRLACREPIRQQQLHLLVVGLGVKDKKKLVQQAFSALQIQPDANQELRSPAFARVFTYGPLTDFVGPERIITQLERIRFQLSVKRGVNDVVMLYYQGGESVNDRGRFFLLTSASAFDPNLETSAITGDDLANFFDMTPGAHLLLLDVARTKAEQAIATAEPARLVSEWPEESRIGLLRQTWLASTSAPPDASLLVALGETLPRARTARLKEVGDGLLARFDRLRTKYPDQLAYDQHLPANLLGLVVVGQ